MMLLLDHKLVSRVKICLVSVFPDIGKNCPKMRNLLEIFQRSFENVGLETETRTNGVFCPENVCRIPALPVTLNLHGRPSSLPTC